MTTIIAIETSTELASAALLHNDQVIARQASGAQTHSHSILPMVQNLLLEAGLGLVQCDAVAFGAGPGSFTGVRTACGIAQGLAFGADLPVVAVGTLLAMAEACREQFGAADVLALLDARMEEVYWAQYRFDEEWRTVVDPTLSPATRIESAEPAIMCGNALAAYEVAFSRFPASVDRRPSIMPHARQIARLGRIAYAQGKFVPARDAQPVYLRNKVALTTIERMSKVAA
ncbi:MAG: yeaZ [Noviherbaspirillum sp.]|jgi:tRNA threonylcarbamoyladenosine biosynthesis protein TsaB|nr:yeaZ [Noviherbaspirillum sp.]